MLTGAGSHGRQVGLLLSGSSSVFPWCLANPARSWRSLTCGRRHEEGFTLFHGSRCGVGDLVATTVHWDRRRVAEARSWCGRYTRSWR